MASPRPYGLHVISGELSQRDNDFIASVIHRFLAFKEAAQLENFKRVYDLPDGGFFIVQDMGGIFKIIVDKQVFDPSKIVLDGFAKLYIPMLYSGVILESRIRENEGVKLRLSHGTLLRLGQYEKPVTTAEVRLSRFDITPNEKIVPEFVSENPGPFHMTQYSQQRPTWYSGAMAELMQIVGGYGSHQFNQLPDSALERAQVSLPEKYREAIAEYLLQVRLPGYSGIPPADGKFQFDYKLTQTNAVTFDSEGYPWLVRVGPTGIYAMPLPVIPATTAPEFREWMEEVGDQEILNILDRFKGMPSGEGFPQDTDFGFWLRAGVIIKVCEVEDFFNHLHYSPNLGWSFNLTGSEGFHTCYKYNDQGVVVGSAYKIRINITAVSQRGWLRESTINAEHAQAVSQYMAKLKSLIPVSSKGNAIYYKLRLSPDQLIARANMGISVGEKEIEWWDQLELDPITSATGRVSKVGEGLLYHPALPEFQPQIKFPVVAAGGCISFDFSSTERIPEDLRPNCDTIMFGYYIGNNLKVVKYFYDMRSYSKEVESDFEKVMAVGSWNEVETSGSSSVQGHFYTSDFDHREILEPYKRETSIVGKDKGYNSTAFSGFNVAFGMQGLIWRNRYYTHLTKTKVSEGAKLELGICIPYLNRNAVLLAKKTEVHRYETENFSLHAMQDPYTYKMWTYDRIWHWTDPLEKMTGKPSPVDGSPVWAEIEVFNPDPDYDFANQGPWLSSMPLDVTEIVYSNGHYGIPQVQEYYKVISSEQEEAGSLELSMLESPVQVMKKIPHGWYFYISPDPNGAVFYRDACRVVFGDIEYGNISETNDDGVRYRWGYTSLVNHSRAYHFIGVINE